ncbi:t-cell immunomodulatory protein [Anaeramoeba ignava]|uniref:T-cell immunomodulatory protein n=1 Tax=Anaeramoeba ignava TaxID=1746090 RepID=A0A9Q0LAV3_ANAIG|nr:t-cell immunomodulatory protein [Anaeramoeba ignava]
MSTLFLVLLFITISLLSFIPTFVPSQTNKLLSLSNQSEKISEETKITGKIGCLGDFNNDRYTDLFIISSNKRKIEVYEWDQKYKEFFPNENAFINFEEDESIEQIVAGDFTYNGKLDLLVVGSKKTQNSTGKGFMRIYQGNNYEFFEKPIELNYSKQQILVMDVNNDFRSDILGVSSETGKKTFWINNIFSENFNDSSAFIEKDWDDIFSSDQHPSREFSYQNSNSFVDLNGDCLPDLFVTSVEQTENGNQTFFEIWINKKTHFEFYKEYLAPNGAGQVSFADFNSDGAIDMIFPVCYPAKTCSEKNEIHIVFNKQMKICGDENSDSCRKSSKLCSADDSFIFDFENTIVIPTESFNNEKFFSTESIPFTIHVGDFNIDGFPDILFVMQKENSQETSVQLWENVDCIGCRGFNPRIFKRKTDSLGKLNDLKYGFVASFMDIGESGTLDIVVQSNPGIFSNQQNYISLFKNNIFHDAYFFKTFGLNGVCNAWCPTPPAFPNPKPYGTGSPGATFKFTFTGIDSTKIYRGESQLTQSHNLALQTPYVFFGLGRTNNYIEDLYMGISSTNQDHFNTWHGIIPNSQMFIIPYPNFNTKDWQIELFLQLSNKTLYVVLGIFIWLIAIGFLILFYHIKEKKQDRKENIAILHLFEKN